MRLILLWPFLLACEPAKGVSSDIAVNNDTGEQSGEPTSEPTSEPNEPTSEPTNEASNEPTSDPTGDPTGEPTGEPTSEPSNEPSSQEDPCETIETSFWTVGMDYTANCDWGNSGNESASDGLFRARTEQYDSFQVDSDQQICDIRFAFESDFGGVSGSWGYDDHFVLALNNRVLITSQESLLDRLAAIDNSYYYSWTDILDAEMGFEPDVWVIGGNSSDVTFPYPEFGAFGGTTIYIDSGALEPHRQAAMAENEINMMLAVFGDNEQGDCYQSGFYINVEIDVASR